MKLKSIFGFCSYEGCKKKFDYEAEIKAETKEGKVVKKNIRLCHDHAMQLAQEATSARVICEQPIDLF